MHELHLMRQVVKAVEAGLEGAPRAKPILVRVKIQASSHLWEHDADTLRTAFDLAACGTRAEGAKLDIIAFSGETWCSRCKTEGASLGASDACAMCGGPILTGQAAPEMVVHEVVVEE